MLLSEDDPPDNDSDNSSANLAADECKSFASDNSASSGSFNWRESTRSVGISEL